MRAFKILLVAPLILTSAATAQPPSGTFGETIDVTVVNVEMVVTDKAGNRVTGLTAEDFTLIVDGQARPIDYFTEIRDRRVTKRAGADTGAVSPPAVTGIQGEVVANNYLVFVDDVFLGANNRRVVHRLALDRLAAEVPTLLGPEDQMAVVGYAGGKLRILEDWTRSVEDLTTALAKLAEERVAMPADFEMSGVDWELQEQMEATAGDGSSGLSGGAVTQQPLPASPPILDAEVDRFRRTLRRANEVVEAAAVAQRALRAPPGRKIMLLLSTGWPVNTLKEEVRTVTMGERDGLAVLRPLTDTSNRLGYTVYSIHLGRQADLMAGASDRRMTDPLVPGSLASADRAMAAGMNQNTLVFTSAQTGGKLILGHSDEILADVIQDTRSYYWLGFTWSGGGDDRRRNIKVDGPKGLRIRARDNFLPQTIEMAKKAEVESALLVERDTKTPSIEVAVGEIVSRRKTMIVPISITIPMDHVTMIQEKGRYVGRLELRIGALDAEGDRSDIPTIPVVLEGPTPPPAGSHAIYDTSFKVKREAQDLVLHLSDLVGGETMTGRITVKP